MKERIQQELQTLWELEVHNQIDNFEGVVTLVDQYKTEFGQDEFIREFSSEYLADRHQRRDYVK